MCLGSKFLKSLVRIGLIELNKIFLHVFLLVGERVLLLFRELICEIIGLGLENLLSLLPVACEGDPRVLAELRSVIAGFLCDALLGFEGVAGEGNIQVFELRLLDLPLSLCLAPQNLVFRPGLDGTELRGIFSRVGLIPPES